jgi:hypothetical protein
MARWARVSFVEATIFMVLVIFSMLRMDFRRPGWVSLMLGLFDMRGWWFRI